MTAQDIFASSQSELNGFLFADIGTERSGMTLSVLSALARLGVDPWQEAARLARLPRGAAIEGLARAITSLPAGIWSLAEATVIAARLVPLLPSGATRALPQKLNPTRRQRFFGVLMLTLLATFAIGVMLSQGAPSGPAPSSPHAPAPAGQHAAAAPDGR